MNTQSPMLHTVSAACKALNLGRTSIYKLIQNGHLEVVKINTSTRITDSSLRKVASEGTSTSAA